MSARALVSDQVHTLVRKNPATGFTERTTFVGSLRDKPKGWKVNKSVRPTCAMAKEVGLA
ncbi:MAG: hypothetical protein K8L99_19120 [Anaerolineae bacterium]|nr:hypothetical protein [Anaerolineae bacterium]